MNISDTTVSVVIDLVKRRNDAYDKYIEKYFPDHIIVYGNDEHRDSFEYNQYRRMDHELTDFLMV